MARELSRPKDPVALASFAAALRAYLSPTAPKGGFKARVRTSMNAAKVDKKAARRMLDRFEGIRPSIRTDVLGAMGNASWTPPVKREGLIVKPSATPIVMSLGVFNRIQPFDGSAGILDPSQPRPAQPPTYTIRYRGFHCASESNWDQGTPSDEVYVVTSAVHINPDGTNTVRSEKHPVNASEYGNVDNRDTRLGPIAACWQGQADPVSLIVTAFEHDQGDPDEYKDEINAAIVTALAIASIWFPGARLILALEFAKGWIAEVFNWFLGTGDDQIDEPQTVILPHLLMDAYGSKRYRVYEYQVVVFGQTVKTVYTELKYMFATTHKGSGAEYVFGFDIQRNPAFPPRIPDID